MAEAARAAYGRLLDPDELERWLDVGLVSSPAAPAADEVIAAHFWLPRLMHG